MKTYEKEPRMTTMMSVEELAERWGVSQKTIYAAVKNKQVIGLRIGRILRIARSHVEALEERGAYGGSAAK